MAPQMHHVDNSQEWDEDVANTIKRLIAIVRQDRSIIRNRYEHACSMMENTIINDFTIAPEDMQQKLHDYKNVLWEKVYEPSQKEYSILLRSLEKIMKRR